MKKRVIGAALIILVFVPLLLIGGLPFKLMITLISILGMREILKIRGSKKEFPIIMELISYLLVSLFTLYCFDSRNPSFLLDYRLISLLVLSFMLPVVFINDDNKFNLTDSLFLMASTLFIGFTMNLLIVYRIISIHYVVYLFLITTMTDTFAYFTGMYIGKHKLAPKISPKKTIEGLIGGTIMGTFVSSVYFNTVIGNSISITLLIVMSVTLSLLGQVGDLFFSTIKRHYGKKDFSHLIPGHGGILDRLDSIVFVVMGFLLFMTLL